MLSPTRTTISNTEPRLQHSCEPQHSSGKHARKPSFRYRVPQGHKIHILKILRLRWRPLELCESRVGFPSTNRLKSPRNACSSNSSESAEDRRRYVQNGLKSEMPCITLRTMGAKSNFPHGEGLDPEPIPPQASRRHLSNDQPMDQPFNEWHPHRMKTGLRNHPIGRKASMVILPLLRYKAAASQNENTRGAPVNDQSRLVASSPTVPNSALTQLTSSGDKGNSKRTRGQESR
jgi:hypothetical protein